MTERQLQQVISQLPEGEHFDRAYSAFEGGIRVISRDDKGCEYRYSVSFDAEDNASIQRF